LPILMQSDFYRSQKPKQPVYCVSKNGPLWYF